MEQLAKHPHGKNVVFFLGGSTKFCVISFLKGCLMKDPVQPSTAQGENTYLAINSNSTACKRDYANWITLKEYIAAAYSNRKRR